MARQERLKKERKPLLLTEFVLVEIVPLSSELLEEAFILYKKRMDKGWGLTDCTLFVVMRRYGIMDALTTDDHFQQAGFRALLREDAIPDR